MTCDCDHYPCRHETERAAAASAPDSKALLAEIRTMLANLYEPDEAEKWLESENGFMVGTPRKLIEAGEGHRVKDVLQAILDGAYL